MDIVTLRPNMWIRGVSDTILGVIRLVYQYWAVTVALRRCFSMRILLLVFFFFLRIKVWFFSKHSQRSCSFGFVCWPHNYVNEILRQKDSVELMHIDKCSFVMLFSVVQKWFGQKCIHSIFYIQIVYFVKTYKTNIPHLLIYFHTDKSISLFCIL